jgi:DNA-binding transcriptional regulator YiaG
MSDGPIIERRRLEIKSSPNRTATRRRLAAEKPASALPAAECEAQRKSLGWSMQDLALRSGFPVTTLAEFENGQRDLGLSARVALQRILRKGARATHT